MTIPTIPTVTATAGTAPLPTEYSFGCVYRDRLLLTGVSNAIYCSRLGTYSDWSYGLNAEDTGRATIFQLAEAGDTGEIPTALVPHKDNFLIAGTAGELWLLSGDPVTGAMRNLSRNAGIVGPRAWAKNDDTVFFLAPDGLQAVSASGGEPQNLSREKIPEELLNVDGDHCLLAYNDLEKGVYIFTEGATYQWFYDLVAGGFWPMTTTVVPNQATIDNGLLVLAKNGTEVVVGGVESFTSHVLLGPLRMSAPGYFGRILNFKGNTGVGSDDVIWHLIPGNSAEEATENAKAAIAGSSQYVSATGTLSAGQSHLWYPRIRAPWMVVWLSSTGAWAYESLALESVDSGKWR